MLETGIQAPEFTLQDQDGQEVSLKDFRGKKVVLYFYSKDNTAGCTKQACSFAEMYPQFMEKNAVVIGISKDTAASHKRFAEKYQLPFTLLADPNLQAVQLYDVWKEKNMYGKKVMGVVRTTYLIDENGIIEKAFTKVKAAENAGQMLGTLSESL
ncbi:thioredoxin-dependent thiol peroxidase [Diplocloster hominis]|uniref:thioredoxin-dependent thiol peroxidase n=1 Tax=Diplocloster hominis TaxID=3079010 RepID=UPI0031BA4003